MPDCIICNTQNAVFSDTNRMGWHKISCPRCGIFRLYDTAVEDLPGLLRTDNKKRAILSHKISRSQVNNREPRWSYEACENVIDHHDLPSVSEQIDGTLEWIGRQSEFFGHDIDIGVASIEAYAGVLKPETIFRCLETLSISAYIEFNGTVGGSHTGSAELTAHGWQRYKSLIQGDLSYNKAFMAMKFNDDELNSIVKDYFKPAVAQTGYELFRLDDRPEAGLIDIRLRQEIKTSKFLIADLTHDNLGAYWEAGFAEGIGKKVIYTCREDRFEVAKTHFDVNHHLTIRWSPDSPEQAVDDLKAAIRYTFPEAKQQDT